MIEQLLEPGFGGRIGRTVAESEPWWPAPVKPPAGAPNVLVIVLDDVGFAQLGCYGSDIATPSMDALATGGVQFTNFHVTPLCSPTRACVLTGRNHHSVGMGMIAGFPSGFPSGRERVSHRAAMVPSVLRDAGYRTYGCGKWHLGPMTDTTAAGPWDHWPLAHGFDRYYGFFGGETDQYRPNLFVDNQVALPPDRDDYHLSEDLADQAVKMIAGHRSVAPDRPFFLYLAFGACHGPHQVPEPYRSRYRHAYDDGWDAAHVRWHQRQLDLGVIPPGTGLAPRNSDVLAWDSLSEDERVNVARFQEVFAGFLEHTDMCIGRVLAGLETMRCADDTLVLLISDNGAAGEGGQFGSWNELIPFNGISDDELKTIAGPADIGAPDTYPIYPRGWAQVGNTPLKWYKHHTYGGGVRAPLIARWPAHGVGDGGFRTEFQHAIDLTPTILEAAGLAMPESVGGVAQLPLHGRSFLSSLRGDVPVSAPRTQYFEMEGHRGIYHDGWKAVTRHLAGTSFDDERWELYDLTTDFAELRDLGTEHPERLVMIRELWWHEAGRFGVTPLDDRFLERANNREGTELAGRTRYEYFRGMPRLPEGASADVRVGNFTISTTVQDLRADDHGVIVAFGGCHAGFVLYVDEGHLCLDYNSYGQLTHLQSDGSLPAGTHDLVMSWRTASGAVSASLLVDGAEVASAPIERPVPYYTGGHGFDVGGNWLSPVSNRYVQPFEFTGHFDSVVIELSPGDLDVTQAKTVAARAD